jgi:hypothetical protein
MPTLRIRVYTSAILIILGVLGVLGTVCAYSSYIPAGETSYQWLWSGRMAIMFSICALFSIILSSWSIVLFHRVLSWGVVLMAGILAVWGILQIYGFIPSNHPLYSVTGSFYNPGPYSGYLALAFPICLYEWLSLRVYERCECWRRIAGCLFLGVLLLSICILPAGLSRSAWLAVSFSTIFVCGMHYKWITYLKKEWQLHYKRLIGIIVLLLIIILFGGGCLYSLKPDSARGRLFMWKISSLAIMEKPFRGHGAGSFTRVYGQTQERYFALGNYSKTEERVAGSPRYAFNEYLRIAVEFGIPILLIILVGIGYCLYIGIKRSRIGVCGGVLSLLIFSFSSYPMEYPCFLFLLLFLLIACLTGNSRIPLLIFILLVGVVGIKIVKTNLYEVCCDWSQCRMLCDVHAYSEANAEYKRLYPFLQDRSHFLFEYGRYLHKQKEYCASIAILKEAAEISCDPMILNIIGKNYHLLEEYEEAEKWFIRSTYRLPGRIYPYYLLAQLYAEPAFYQPEKLNYMANIVLTKEPKIHSVAIEEMRMEIRKLLKNNNSATTK